MVRNRKKGEAKSKYLQKNMNNTKNRNGDVPFYLIFDLSSHRII